MYELTPANHVWNRAVTEGGCPSPRAGDLALAELLRAHGLAMNGGVLHACELLTPDELAAAQRGYQFFGLPQAATLLGKAKVTLDKGVDLGTHERKLDSEYSGYIPSDSAFVSRFQETFSRDPGEFSPL